MEIKRNGSQPSGKGPADYFTGTVRIDPLFQASEPARATGRAGRGRASATTPAPAAEPPKTEPKSGAPIVLRSLGIVDALYRVVPAFDSLRTYNWRSLRLDLVAGLTVAAVAVPQASKR